MPEVSRITCQFSKVTWNEATMSILWVQLFTIEEEDQRMKLKEAIAIKAREQGILTMAVMPNCKSKPRCPQGTSTDEEIYQAWLDGNSIYSISKRLCKCGTTRVKRIIQEREKED